jgi:hypothetical protein
MRQALDEGVVDVRGGDGPVATSETLTVKLLDQRPVSGLATRLELLRNTLRPTPHVPLAMKGMDLFAKLEYVNPVGSIKDRAAYWILQRAAERGEIGEETTVIESSSGNFAAALAAFTHLLRARRRPSTDPSRRSRCLVIVAVDEGRLLHDESRRLCPPQLAHTAGRERSPTWAIRAKKKGPGC